MIEFLKKMIVQAGEICRKEQAGLKPADVGFKNKKDLVTCADKAVEAFIIDCIHSQYPSHNIWGEETGNLQKDSDYLWIIDPIDGTTSYLHQQPFYAVSIAVQHKKNTICSAVYAPALDELFYADINGPAFLNGKPIHVSQTTRLINSVMATGFACLRGDLKKNNLPYFNKIVPRLRDIRRYGSAAIDLCWVACGKLDGFWEMNLNIYDIAAGAFIVQQAKGIVCDFNGESSYPGNGIIASNPTLSQRMRHQFF